MPLLIASAMRNGTTTGGAVFRPLELLVRTTRLATDRLDGVDAVAACPLGAPGPASLRYVIYAALRAQHSRPVAAQPPSALRSVQEVLGT
jgi:hypothetical protein